jgi:Coenzyme PQQ synthesis protein D (PqqD)
MTGAHGEPPSAAIAGAFVPVPKGSVTKTEIDGEAVLLDNETGSLHVLNSTGAAIWLALDGTRTTDEIVSELSEAAAADPSRVRVDVKEFLRSLVDHGLLERSPPGADG